LEYETSSTPRDRNHLQPIPSPRIVYRRTLFFIHTKVLHMLTILKMILNTARSQCVLVRYGDLPLNTQTCNIFGGTCETVQMVGIAGPRSSRRRTSGRRSNEATMTLWPSEIAYLDTARRLARPTRHVTRYYRATRSCKRRVRCHSVASQRHGTTIAAIATTSTRLPGSRGARTRYFTGHSVCQYFPKAYGWDSFFSDV